MSVCLVQRVILEGGISRPAGRYGLANCTPVTPSLKNPVPSGCHPQARALQTQLLENGSLLISIRIGCTVSVLKLRELSASASTLCVSFALNGSRGFVRDPARVVPRLRCSLFVSWTDMVLGSASRATMPPLKTRTVRCPSNPAPICCNTHRPLSLIASSIQAGLPFRSVVL